MKTPSLLSALVLIFIILSCNSQPKGYLEKNALVIDDALKINNSVYNQLKEYDAILIGELHGTNECADLAYGIAKKFASSGERVLVGFEIPHDQLEDIDNNHSISALKKSSFFSSDYQDGRGSVKWAETVSQLMDLANVDIVFYDNTSEEWNNSYWVSRRDSLMFEKINAAIAKFEPTKLITISGNTHNQLQPMWTDFTMGHFLETHPRSYLRKRKILSLVNKYDGGSAMNNTGNGLEYMDMGQRDSSIYTSFGADNYILIYEDKEQAAPYFEEGDWHLYGYNGMFFTKTISAARPFE